MKKIILSTTFTCFSFFYSISAQNTTIQSIINSVNIDSLMYRTREISGEVGVVVNGATDTIFSRNKSRPGNELCFKYIRDKFISYGYQVDSMVFSATGKSIWAIKTGLVYPDEPVIICGHYDGMPNVAIAPAADDDGSGTAAVLEAARVLAPYDFEYTIKFCLWDEEEYGLAGSAAFAAACSTAHDTIHAVFNMDAIAFDSDNDSVARVHARPPGNSEEIADTVVAVNLNYHIGLDLLLINPGMTYSDHASFWNKNYGAVLIIQDWEGDSNPHYHTITDKVQYFNIPYFHKLARLAIGSTAAFAIPYVIPPAGIEDEPEEIIKLFPNPTQGVLNIKWQKEYETIQVVDLLGKTVYTSIIAQGSKFISVDLTSFTHGIYFAQLLNGNQKITKKFIVN
jgi:hypothetical protein